MNLTEWQNRKPEVQVFERCDGCGTLKQDVSKREESGHYPSKWTVAVTSCASCFDVAKKLAREQAGSTALVCMETTHPAAIADFARGWNDAAAGRSFDLAKFPSVEYCAGFQDSISGSVE